MIIYLLSSVINTLILAFPWLMLVRLYCFCCLKEQVHFLAAFDISRLFEFIGSCLPSAFKTSITLLCLLLCPSLHLGSLVMPL